MPIIDSIDYLEITKITNALQTHYPNIRINYDPNISLLGEDLDIRFSNLIFKYPEFYHKMIVIKFSPLTNNNEFIGFASWAAMSRFIPVKSENGYIIHDNFRDEQHSEIKIVFPTIFHCEYRCTKLNSEVHELFPIIDENDPSDEFLL